MTLVTVPLLQAFEDKLISETADKRNELEA